MATATQFASTKAAAFVQLAKDLQESKIALAQAEAVALCPNLPSEPINYTSNSTVSASLKRWIQEDEKINDASWAPVWNNSDVTMHKLTGEFLYIYIVYFDEPPMGYHNSVYSVGQGCFIDY